LSFGLNIPSDAEEYSGKTEYSSFTSRYNKTICRNKERLIARGINVVREALKHSIKPLFGE
jgi:hypothetical protein